MNLEELHNLVASGKRPRFLFFWGHTPDRPDRVGAECLSQWYQAPFDRDGIRYPTAEHFMMAEKARLFGDVQQEQRILGSSSPSAAKASGRRVRGFREDVWTRRRYDIVVAGNLAKFSQNVELQKYLLATGSRVIVEASPRDRIWGIGLSASNDKASNPLQWRGLNLLGFALMDVREQLAARGGARPGIG